jgi:hypothetical protein
LVVVLVAELVVDDVAALGEGLEVGTGVVLVVDPLEFCPEVVALDVEVEPVVDSVVDELADIVSVSMKGNVSEVVVDPSKPVLIVC